MIKALFEKLLCKHKWKTYKSTRYRRDSAPDAYNYTKEILICEHCGKIKTIEY